MDPQVYRHVTARWVGEFPNLQVYVFSTLAETVANSGKIREINWEHSSSRDSARQTGRASEPAAVIDATGCAEIVRDIAPDRIQDDSNRAAGGLICRISGVSHEELQFPRNVELLRALRRASQDGRLPASCGQAWLDMGAQPNEIYVKLFVPLPDGWTEPENLKSILAQANDSRNAVIDFLQTLPGLAEAKLVETGSLGIRDGGGIEGEYILTREDVRAGRKFPDAACRCCWPIEYWDPKSGVKVEYLSAGTFYEIPLRALRVKGWSNLWAAGKCLSADHYGRASARCVGTCWAMGEAIIRALSAEIRREASDTAESGGGASRTVRLKTALGHGVTRQESP